MKRLLISAIAAISLMLPMGALAAVPFPNQTVTVCLPITWRESVVISRRPLIVVLRNRTIHIQFKTDENGYLNNLRYKGATLGPC